MQQQHSDEWHRLSSVSSPAARLAAHVDDLVQVRDHELPGWLTGLRLPAGWRLASVQGQAVKPSRIAVRVPSAEEGGYGCDTLNLYRFTGDPAVDAVESYADATLHDLRAEGITSRRLVVTPPIPGVTAVCATGYFTTGDLPVWAQCCTYVAGSQSPGQAMLIEHSLFIESRCLTALTGDVIELSRAVHASFVNAAGRGVDAVVVSGAGAMVDGRGADGLVVGGGGHEPADDMGAQGDPGRHRRPAPDRTQSPGPGHGRSTIQAGFA